MTDRERLFAIAALTRGLITEEEFAARYAVDPTGAADDLVNKLVSSGRLPVEESHILNDLLDDRFQREQQQSLQRLVRRHAREQALGVRDDRALAILERWISLCSPSDDDSALQLVNGRETRGYQLVRIHAEGGMGQVWEALDPSLGREVAIKRLRPHLTRNPEARQRLWREAIITAQLEHPSIVPVHEIGEEAASGMPYFSMRLLGGRTLRQAIASFHAAKAAGKAERQQLHRLLGSFVAVCNAVAFAHSRAVIHRDLKPDNVLVGDFGEVVLLDWGLAKLATGEKEEEINRISTEGDIVFDRTITGAHIGTPSYMAPEQATGDTQLISAATDIYGLGAILFELLTNSPPHLGRPGDEKTDFYRHIAASAPPRAIKRAPQTDAALDAICTKAMAVKAADRYTSALALAEDIERWRAGDPVSVYREPFFRRLARYGAAHPIVSSSVAWFLVIFVICAAFLFTASIVEHRQTLLIAKNEIERQWTYIGPALEERLANIRQDARVLSQLDLTVAALKNESKQVEQLPESSILKEFLGTGTGYLELGFVRRDHPDVCLLHAFRHSDGSIKFAESTSLPKGFKGRDLVKLGESAAEPILWYEVHELPVGGEFGATTYIVAPVTDHSRDIGYIWLSFDIHKMIVDIERTKRFIQTNIITDATGRILSCSPPMGKPSSLQTEMLQPLAPNLAEAELAIAKSCLEKHDELIEFIRSEPSADSPQADTAIIYSGPMLMSVRRLPLGSGENANRLGFIAVMDLSLLHIGGTVMRNSLLEALLAVIAPTTILFVLGWLVLRQSAHLR